MIPAESIRALGNEYLHIQEAKIAGALGKLTSGKMRQIQLPRVNLPVPKVVP